MPSLHPLLSSAPPSRLTRAASPVPRPHRSLLSHHNASHALSPTTLRRTRRCPPRHRTKPTVVGKGRNGVSKTGKYSIKRRKLLYFSAFLIALFTKTPLNSRGGKIPRVFSPSCRSMVILRFSGGERILLRAFRPPLLMGRERVFRALLLLRCFFCSFFSYPPRSSPNRLAPAKAKPRSMRGFAPFFSSFADGLSPSPTADAFLPATV